MPSSPRPAASTFRYHLNKVGLKPHTLRKLCASKLARQDKIKEQDLLKVFGWASMETASIYLQAKNNEELAALMEGE
jgi:integrase